jgi:hypothetical protein
LLFVLKSEAAETPKCLQGQRAAALTFEAAVLKRGAGKLTATPTPTSDAEVKRKLALGGCSAVLSSLLAVEEFKNESDGKKSKPKQPSSDQS